MRVTLPHSAQRKHAFYESYRTFSITFTGVIFPCVVWKANAHVDKKLLNIRHQAQKGFCGTFVGIPQHQKGYIMNVLNTRKIISSYDVFLGECFSIALVYMSRPYSEAMAMRLSMTYTTYAISSEKQTGDIIALAQFEEGDLLS